MKQNMDKNTEILEEIPETDGQEPSETRRDAIKKMAYASPVIAGLMFSNRAAAQFTPPAPP